MLTIIPFLLSAQLIPKELAVQEFRLYFSEHGYRGNQLDKGKVEQLTPQQCIDLPTRKRLNVEK